MKKCIVLFHGDCDGAIATGLYVRRFLVDMFPNHIVLKHSHPWRLRLDLKKILAKPSVDMVVLVDLALSEEDADIIAKGIEKGVSVTIIDHHQSSQKAIERLRNLNNVKALWAVVQSTPQVLAQTVLKSLNNYERLLVNIANVCEGGSTEDAIVKLVADKIKLVLAVEPTNVDLICKSVEHIIKGEEFWNTSVFDEVYWKAKWLLNLLLKKIDAKAKTVCNWDIASFTLPESLIFAGLFGVASSEYMKKVKRSVALVREEEDKLVVTVRSTKKRALDLCNAIMSNVDSRAKSAFGGHKEAASLTIKKVYSLEEVEKIVESTIKSFECEAS